jgi:hypothetical protein
LFVLLQTPKKQARKSPITISTRSTSSPSVLSGSSASTRSSKSTASSSSTTTTETTTTTPTTATKTPNTATKKSPTMSSRKKKLFTGPIAPAAGQAPNIELYEKLHHNFKKAGEKLELGNTVCYHDRRLTVVGIGAVQISANPKKSDKRACVLLCDEHQATHVVSVCSLPRGDLTIDTTTLLTAAQKKARQSFCAVQKIKRPVAWRFADALPNSADDTESDDNLGKPAQTATALKGAQPKTGKRKPGGSQPKRPKQPKLPKTGKGKEIRQSGVDKRGNSKGNGTRKGRQSGREQQKEKDVIAAAGLTNGDWRSFMHGYGK